MEFVCRHESRVLTMTSSMVLLPRSGETNSNDLFQRANSWLLYNVLVVSAQRFKSILHYLSSVHQSPGVQKSKSIFVTMVIPSPICIVITLVYIMLNKKEKKNTRGQYYLSKLVMNAALILSNVGFEPLTQRRKKRSVIFASVVHENNNKNDSPRPHRAKEVTALHVINSCTQNGAKILVWCIVCIVLVSRIQW